MFGKKAKQLYKKLWVFFFWGIANLSYSQPYQQFADNGRERFQQGFYEKAIYNFEAAMECEDYRPEYNVDTLLYKSKNCLNYQNLAEAFFENEDYKQALFFYGKVLSINEMDLSIKKSIDLCLEKLSLHRAMIFVEGGCFKMGSDDGEKNEKPVHDVCLSDFYIDSVEVTNSEYAYFLNIIGNKQTNGTFFIDIEDPDCLISYENGIYKPKIGFENFPVVEVSWYGADAYAKFFKKQLPTEAQWEYAARGGKNSNGYTYSGHSLIDSVAWYRNNTINQLYPVGQKKANELGIYDLSGNVWEWCDDWYWENFYQLSLSCNPVVVNENEHKVLRGGACTSDKSYLRISYRSHNSPSITHKNFGFRCVISID